MICQLNVKVHEPLVYFSLRGKIAGHIVLRNVSVDLLLGG